jgi:hypothetical protein
MSMLLKENDVMKHPRDACQPFPWKCRNCGQDAVEMATIEYAAELRRDGRLHSFIAPALRIPVCQVCGEKVFTEDVDRQVNDAFLLHLQSIDPNVAVHAEP